MDLTFRRKILICMVELLKVSPHLPPPLAAQNNQSQYCSFVNTKNEIVKRIFWRLPIQIFDKVRKFYLGDFRKEELKKGVFASPTKR
jgi:hypothetical protein